MSRKRDKPTPRVQFSPTRTVADMSEDFIRGLHIPELPEGVPQRLAEAIDARVKAYLFQLREARRAGYVPVLEIRLIRDALRAVLTAYELGLPDAEVNYATFRKLVEELGYERVEVGFARRASSQEGE